jgi:ribulose-phosphate 3-epimerase
MKISPSVLACDFTRLGSEVQAMQEAGAHMIHLDIMDGHFVPNITFGAPLLRSLRPATSLLFDVHLMISDPLRYALDFIAAGAGIVTFHLECDSDIDETLRVISEAGVKTGLALKPATPAAAGLPYLDRVDMVLVMTVEPGFGGQSFMVDQMDKLSDIRAAINKTGRAIDLQVDGGIDTDTAPIVARHGANVLVAGSSLFRQPDYKAAVKELIAAAV